MEQEAKLEQFSAIETKIRSVGSELDGKVYDITTGKGLKEAKADRAIWRKMRIGVKEIHKETKADVLILGRAIDAEAKRLIEIIVGGGAHVEGVVKDEEDRKAAEKAERERLERKRIDDIHDRIDDFKFNLSEYHPPEDLQKRLDELEAMAVDDSFGEFEEKARTALDVSMLTCRACLDSAKERAEKDAAAAVEKAQADRQLKAQAAAQAKEADRLAEERATIEADKKKTEEIVKGTACEQLRLDGKKNAERMTLSAAMAAILEICDSDNSPQVKVNGIRIVAVEYSE